MRLLVTGGSGYLGRALLAAAPAAWEVAGTRLTAAGELTQLDVRDQGAVTALLERLLPDCVVHTAYVQAGPAMREVNVAGSCHVARAAWAAGSRLIHISTDVVFDGEREGLWHEDDRPGAITDYGRAKADAERAVLTAHPTALVVRTSLLYGGEMPVQHERMVFDALDGSAETRFFSDEVRCPIAVGDLAAALLELASAGESGILHLAGPVALSRFDFARLIARAAGGDEAMVRPARSADLPGSRPRNCALDSSRAHAVLRTAIRAPEEVLQG